MKTTILVTAFFLILTAGSLTQAAQSKRGTNIRADLDGFEETPSVITAANGTFSGTIASDENSITYTLTYSGLQGTVTQAHIHVGQPAQAGSIVIWLCQTAGTPAPKTVPTPPDCPGQGGTVTGTVTAADVIAASMTSQQINAGEFADVITAIKNGVAYANVHSNLSPGGEIRGQIKTGRR
jgi:hypothetical protein